MEKNSLYGSCSTSKREIAIWQLILSANQYKKLDIEMYFDNMHIFFKIESPYKYNWFVGLKKNKIIKWNRFTLEQQ